VIQVGFVVVGGLCVDVRASDEETAAALADGLRDLLVDDEPFAPATAEFMLERSEAPWVHWRFTHDGDVVEPALDAVDVPATVLRRLDTLVDRLGVPLPGAALADPRGAVAVVGSFDFELVSLAADSGLLLASAVRVVVTRTDHVVAYPRPLPIHGGAPSQAGRAGPLRTASSVFGSKMATAAMPLRALALKYQSEGPLRLEPITPAEALELLCHTGRPSPPVALERFRALARLSRAVPVYRLAGQDAAEEFWRTADAAWSAA
jgi:hypothetical protein